MFQVFNSGGVFCDNDLNELQVFADRNRLKTCICTEDGSKIIPGRLGHIYEFSDDLLGVLIIPNPPRRHYWGHTRNSLLAAGLTVLQDGDGEGSASFDPNNPDQSKAAIRAAGVKRKRKISLERRQRLIASLRAAQRRHIRAQESTL